MPYADPDAAREWDRQRQRDRREYMRAYEQTRKRDRTRPPRPPRKHCNAGHAYDKVNTYVRPDGERECRTCKRINRRKTDLTRRAKLAGAFVEVVDPAVVFERDEGVCGICGTPADVADFHVDHVVPIAAGGLHCYANAQTAHPACNLRKGARV